MSLDHLEQQIEGVRERAARVGSAYSTERDAIEKNPNLSASGKSEEIRTITERTKATMANLRAEEAKLANDKRASLERSVMGTVGSDSASIISYRDAQDRADKIEDREDAERMMQRALTSGDKALASAVAQVALAKGYQVAYKTFADHNPNIAADAKDLAQLDRFINDWNMARLFAYSL